MFSLGIYSESILTKNLVMIRLKNKGFTLIEMLVSMVILSGVILLSTSSYSLYITKWGDNFGKFNQVLERSKNIELLTKVLVNTRSYVFNDKGVYKYYFESTPRKVLAITESSFSDPEEGALYKLELEETEEGATELTYQEVNTQRSWLIVPNQEKEWTEKRVIMTFPKEVNFQVFGWGSRDDANNYNQIQYKWHDDFNAAERSVMPEKLKIVDSNIESEYIFSFLDKGTRYLTIYLDKDWDSE